MNSSIRIGIVVGEASGDILGSGLMDAVRLVHPQATFEGIGGPLMAERGFVSFYPMDRLSVMGFVDPLMRLPELLRMRRNLIRHFILEPPDVFIGIDSPDFNLGIELSLRAAGIRTAHYVSPSVWAWRQGRVKKIARAVDLMLTLFPFEASFYREHGVPVQFVGHPLADSFPLAPDVAAARGELAVAADATLIAVLPGSRAGEIRMLGHIFLRAMAWIAKCRPECSFVVPAASAARLDELRAMLDDAEQSEPLLRGRVRLLSGRSREVMTAADVVMITSGTATLEAMLLKKPMVVAYRLSPNSYRILSRLVKTEFIALPNLLAGELLVPELVQEACTAEALGDAVLRWLHDREGREQLVDRFRQIHRDLRAGGSASAASAVLSLLPAPAR